jgi:hypothetical protein
MKTQQHTCAVCGWRYLNAPQRSTSGGASHEICPSCGFESGHTDDDQGFTYEQWRERWVALGLSWSSVGTPKPAGWNPVKDLHALRKRKRPVIPAIRLRKAAALNEADRDDSGEK